MVHSTSPITNKLVNQVRHLIILFISLLLFTSPLFGNSHKGGILYGWETSSGVQLRKFGDNDIHPQYNGDAENGKPNGLGIMTYPDGRIYVGEWKNGKKDGQGTFTFPSGNKYVGEYKDGNMWNVTKYNKDRKYVGEWREGLLWNGTRYDKYGKFIGKYVNGLEL